MERLLEHQQDAEHDHYAGSSPCHPVKEPGVYILSHQAGLVDQQKHKDQHKGEQHAVENLREHQHFEQRETRQQDNSSARAYQPRIQPIKNRGFTEFFVQPGFKPQAFTHCVGRGKRQNRSGK